MPSLSARAESLTALTSGSGLSTASNLIGKEIDAIDTEGKEVVAPLGANW